MMTCYLKIKNAFIILQSDPPIRSANPILAYLVTRFVTPFIRFVLASPYLLKMTLKILKIASIGSKPKDKMVFKTVRREHFRQYKFHFIMNFSTFQILIKYPITATKGNIVNNWCFQRFENQPDAVFMHKFVFVLNSREILKLKIF